MQRKCARRAALDAFEWRIRMEMHRIKASRSDDPAMTYAMDGAQAAADMVGEATGCAAAVRFRRGR